jgi:hypothetical protein
MSCVTYTVASVASVAQCKGCSFGHAAWDGQREGNFVEEHNSSSSVAASHVDVDAFRREMKTRFHHLQPYALLRRPLHYPDISRTHHIPC